VTELTGLAQLAPVLGVVGLVGALVIYLYIMRQSTGTELMTELAERIQEGAMAFLRREYAVLAIFVVVVAALLMFATTGAVALAYITGALCSVLAGFFGMTAATRANVRTTAAAKEHGAAKALRVSFLGGAVMGLSVAALGLVGVGVWYYFTGAVASAAASTRRRRTSAPTWSARSKPASPRTTRVTLRRSRTTSATTSATSRAWALTSSRATSAQ
jgi:K(+)-stimulated pyrophosphate-energized sodium pump